MYFGRVKLKGTLIGLIAYCLTMVCALGQEDTIFTYGQATGKVTNAKIDEASGLVSSAKNPGFLWTHNDSGDEARVFLIDDSARYKATYYLEGISARDWEDIGMMERDGRHYLLIGDIGDNNRRYPYVYVHVFEEPAIEEKQPYVDTIPKERIRSFVMKYEDGPRDAESLFFDPLDKQLYIVSKREPSVGVYYTVLPEIPTDTLMLRKVGSLPHTFITAADISRDGGELLVKNLLEVFYWKRKKGESVQDMLNRVAIKLPYKPEPQGEAIAFAHDGSGYFTLSEVLFGLKAILYFYSRLDTNN